MIDIAPMIVLIDNYDSFTYNLVQYLGALEQELHVVRNDASSADEILDLKPKGIIISPGPSDPDHAGICLEMVQKCVDADMPLLGVCLGHQSIGQALGGKIVQTHPMHGKTDNVNHNAKGLFADIPSPLTIARYHSLVIERESCPDNLEITAENDDGIIMAVQHKTKPIYGVQFHPESIATEHGEKILANFCKSL